MRVDLFESLKSFASTEEGKALTGERARLLEFTLRDFRRNGLHLPEDQRKRVTEIKTRMSALGIQFSKNLGEENAKFTFTRAELKGVPEDQLSRFEKGDTEDKFVVSLKYPDYFPVMELCSVSSTRQKLEYEFNRRCLESNEPILAELIRLRAEQAAILSYPTHAHYVLETRMAKTPEKVVPFLKGLSDKLSPLMNEELDYWKQLKAEEARENGDAAATQEAQTIFPYDIRYFTRLSELKKYKVTCSFWKAGRGVELPSPLHLLWLCCVRGKTGAQVFPSLTCVRVPVCLCVRRWTTKRSKNISLSKW
jgi:Zn-dependent oligopeptidase